MNLSVILKNIAVKLERYNNSLFTFPVEKQKKYINHFKEPVNDIERAFFQYKCQMKFNNLVVNVLLNIASLPMIICNLLKKNKKPTCDEKYNAIFFADGKPDNIIPETLHNNYNKWLTVENKNKYLSYADKKYFFAIAKKYPLSWQFLLKCLMKIEFYSYEIEKHHPDVFVVCNEYSFTSSILTDYCHYRKKKNINVMHGEKLFYMRDSFFHFDECYVWDKAYINLFTELKADSTQFIVAVPKSLKFINVLDIEKKYDYTYYLGAEDKQLLESICKKLHVLQMRGYKVALRPHPRYSNIIEIEKYCKEMKISIEDAKQVSIEKSILSTHNAISGYSTVLNQAFHNGINIVIDDITQPEFFIKLKELKYILLDTNHKLFSEVLNSEL